MTRHRCRSSRIRPPLDHVTPTWLGYENDRVTSWRDLWQSAAAMLGGSGLFWLAYALLRFFT